MCVCVCVCERVMEKDCGVKCCVVCLSVSVLNEVSILNAVNAELDRDPRRLGGLLYDLTFVNVTVKDAQVIQCNISNKHGYNFTNAYINVYSQYPVCSNAVLMADLLDVCQTGVAGCAVTLC